MIIEVLRYIDDTVEQSPTLADIARRAGYSPYHFSRVFSRVMGESVMEYVRGRKLEHAAADIARGERLLDVALRYGFESHEGLTRAFKRRFGVTPRAFRARRGGPVAVSPIPFPHIERSMNMNVIIKALGERNVAGYRIATQPGSAEIPKFWEDIMADDRWARLIGKAAPDGMNFGVCIFPDGMEAGNMDYMIAFDCDPSTPIDPDMERYTIPAAEYAVLATAMQGGGIKEGWNYLYTEWLPKSGYELDEGKNDFEVYPDGERCDIYVPIVRKA